MPDSRPPSDRPDPPDADYLELSRQLRRLARRLVVDDAAADDVVQEAWLAALSQPREAVRGLNAWLRQVVRNIAARQRRQADRRRSIEAFSAPSEAVPSETELVDRIANYRLLRRTAGELREPYRSVLCMRFFEERSVNEIAELLDRPHFTVKTQLQRGLAELRLALDRKHHGERSAWAALLLPITRDAEVSSFPASGAGKSAAAVFAFGLLATGLLWFGMREPGRGEITEIAASPPSAEAASPSLAAGATHDAREDGRSVASTLVPSAPERTEPGPAVRESTLRSVELRVVHADGSPAALAVAQVRRRDRTEFVESDAEGRLRIEVEPSVLLGPPQLREGAPGLVVAARADEEAWSYLVALPVPPVGASIELRTRGPAITLRGRVVDEDGEPLEDALVLIERELSTASESPEGFRQEEFVHTTDTGPDGLFELDGVQRRLLRVYVRAAGCVPLSRTIDAEKVDGEHEEHFVVRRGAVLVGELRHEDGKPAVGARVWLANTDTIGMLGRPLETTADEEGSFALTGLAPGRRRIFAADPRREELFASTVVVVPPLEEDRIVFWDGVLAPTTGVRARVLSAEEAPVEGALAILVAEAADPEWTVTRFTDGGGRVHFPHAPEEALVIVIMRDPSSSKWDHVEMGVRSVADEFEIRLRDPQHTASVRGQVQVADQDVVPHAYVVGADLNGMSEFDTPIDPTTGAFQVENMAAGRYVMWALVEGSGVIPLGQHEVVAAEAYDVGTCKPSPRGTLEITWEVPPPSATAPWVVAARLPLGSSELQKDVATLDSPDERLELLPGTYLLRPAQAPANAGNAGWSFEIRSGETRHGLIAEPHER